MGSCSFKVLFRIQGDARVQNTQFAATALQRLMHLCDSMLRNYAEKERLLQDQPDGASEQAASSGALPEAVTVEIEREVMGLVPIISEVVLVGLKDLPPDLFSMHIGELFPLLCELMVGNYKEVRLMVQEVLLAQVTPLLGNDASASANCGQTLDVDADILAKKK